MERNSVCLILWFISLSLNTVRTEDIQIDEYLDSGSYNKVIRPYSGGGPVVVTVDLFVVAFGIIEEVSMELPVFIYLRQSWSEPRFINQLNSSQILNRETLEKVWRPDTFCTNARETDLMMPDTEIHSSIIAEPDGSVLYSRGSKIVASCNMDLRSFPFDKQKCFLKFGSYSYNADNLLYKWKNSNIEMEDNNLAQFVVTGVKNSITMETYAVGNYSHFLVHFTFERRSGYYVIQVYIPCIIIVIISWIIFWMDIEDTGNRLTVGITSILTIMFLQSFVNSMMPKVSYAKAIDWYLIVSFSFIFLALIECIVIAYNLKTEEKHHASSPAPKNSVHAQEGLRLESLDSESGAQSISNNNLVRVNCAVEHKTEKPKLSRVELMDRSSRIVFPVSYVVLNIAYWSIYAR